MVGFFAFIITLVFGILVLVGGLQWISAQRGERIPPADTERLDRIESALTALESRLDDLQDQQQFLERLLAERSEPRSLGAGGDRTESDAGDVDSILFDRDERSGEGEDR